jgi:hypothetical protein
MARCQLDGNRVLNVRVQASFTVSHTGQTVSKEGSSDPAIPCGRVVAQRIKGTPGITGLSLPSVHSGGAVWHLDVGSSAFAVPREGAVRPLKRYARGGSSGVSQVGPYLLWALHY